MPRASHKTILLIHAAKVTGTLLLTLGIVACMGIILLFAYLFYYDSQYENRIYPHVIAETIDLSGKTTADIMSLWEEKNRTYKQSIFEFTVDSHIATVSGEELGLGYDTSLLAQQALTNGRSGNFLRDLLVKITQPTTEIAPYLRWKEDILKAKLQTVADIVDVPAQDALFEFDNGRVTQFEPARSGKKLNQQIAIQQFKDLLEDVPTKKQKKYPLRLTIEPVFPSRTTAKTNTMGIKEKIGSGYSEFAGSIPGRIFNVSLAASKFHGVLIPPGEIISFNQIIGEISAATGYKPAYIIQNGRTILGDGGGVCQVSTTLFRAGLNAGLPIIERHAHAYRVHYYEEGGFGPGLDATVFSPSYDLKMKNDTPGYILIQTKVDLSVPSMTIELFGTDDGRKATITKPKILSQTAPPPALYQDDPTLPKGVTKQIDWEAWGARTIFDYKVTRGDEQLQNQQFVSNFRPWQAIYLRGTQE